VIGLPLVLGAAAAMAGAGLVAVLIWLAYTSYLNRIERRLAYRKGLYRDLVTGLALRDRALLGPQLRELTTLKDFEALEAVLEEQARGATERPGWLLDAYDHLGLVDKYVTRLRTATQWRERAFAAELLGRVGNAQAVPALLETVAATRTEDADVREIALRALARIGDPRAVGPLVEALKNSEVWLVPRIADILTRHGALSVDPMIAFLEDPARHPARAWAASILGEVGATRAFPALVRALTDLDDEVRAKSASALGRIGDGRAVGYLLDHLLSDPAPFVRARIAQALGQFDEPEVVERLVRALGDPAWWVRMRSVEALEQVGAQAEGPLLLALDDTDPEIRIRAAVALERLGVPARLIATIERGEHASEATETLARFGNAGARELLAEGLAHPAAPVRTAMIEAIQRAGRRDLGPELVGVARGDVEPGLRASAFDVLRTLGVTEGIAAALDHLTDADQRVRAAAMLLVGQLGGPELADKIRPRTTDPDPAVRAATATALGLTQAREASDDFIRLLKDPDASVRAAAARGAADANVHDAGPTLLGLLTDTDRRVQRDAVLALGRLGDGATAVTLLQHLSRAEPELRGAIATAVTRLDTTQVPALVDRLIEAGDRESKLAVIHTVAQLRPPSGASILGVLWRDPDAAVRTATAETLGRLGGAEAVRLLTTGVEDPDQDVRARTVNALARLGSTSAGPAVLALLQRDPSLLVRERAALATGLLRTPGGETALLAASGQADAPLPVRAAALLALGGYEQESMVGRLVDMADDRPLRDFLAERIKHDAEYRLLAQRLGASRHVELQALAATTREGMELSLTEGIRGALDPAERLRLVSGLRAFQGDRSRNALLQVVRSDPNPGVRSAALTAVSGMLDLVELERTAVRALSDPDAEVRRTAVALFGRIAPDRALPSLIRMLQPGDEDPALLQEVARQAESSFDTFVDLTLGLGAGGLELVTVSKVARYIRHPRLPALLPPMAASRAPEVREALVHLWSQRPDLIDAGLLAALAQDPVVAVRVAAAASCAAGNRKDGLAALAADPVAEVRAMAAVAGLLVGTRAALPADAPRGMLAEAAATVLPREVLRSRAADPVSKRRQAAGIVLALLDDPVARVMATDDPVPAIRDAVRAALPGA
jgi:HEAT repeat protein